MTQGRKANISIETLSELLTKYTLKEIAKILDVSLSTIKRYKNKYNLSVNLDIAKQRNSEKHTQYNYNIHYFDKIDTLNKAYLLGFITADGFVTNKNEIGIEVAKKDKDIINFFKEELESTKPIEEKNMSIGLRIQNNTLAKGIKKYGIVPNKSLIINVEEVIKLAQLNEQQISVFLLGYFDGDGCISIAHRQDNNKEYFEMNITGTKETIEYYKKYFDGHGSITKRHNNSNNNYTLQMSNNYTTIYNALSKIYKYRNEITFCLNRKKEKFEKLENKVLLNSDI